MLYKFGYFINGDTNFTPFLYLHHNRLIRVRNTGYMFKV